ncbi:hypothetical protein, partial [Escherichia coli]|uniref:hypothetical protein n=1 Tax=Escherichia coli TaxID=562 RepID=UPI0035AC220F|nr:hypothetical protein [Escherichia coli]
LYASRIGHYDAGNLRGSTPPVFPFIYHCAPYLMGWDVFITFPEIKLTKYRHQLQRVLTAGLVTEKWE